MSISQRENRFVLMNHNHPILQFCADSCCCIIRITEILDLRYAPLPLLFAFQNNEDLEDAFWQWLDERGIPACRKGLGGLLKKLRVTNRHMLQFGALGLSLSDPYWFQPQNDHENLAWEKVNFFGNQFFSDSYMMGTFFPRFHAIEYKPNLFHQVLQPMDA